MSKLKQHPVHDLTHKFPGFIDERSRSVFMMRLQGVDEALEELGQTDAGGVLIINSEAPALHVHHGHLGADALGNVNKPAGLEGEVLMQLGIVVFNLLL